MRKDYYAILGVSRRADGAAIHSAFRALARKYHPDAGPESSSAKFREALEAYHTLSDPALRRRHDIDLAHAARPRHVVAEPLFAPPGAPTYTISGSRDWEQLLADLLRLLDEDFEIPFRLGRTFF
jgi:curved DNA-binding protein CbpA